MGCEGWGQGASDTHRMPGKEGTALERSSHHLVRVPRHRISSETAMASSNGRPDGRWTAGRTADGRTDRPTGGRTDDLPVYAAEEAAVSLGEERPATPAGVDVKPDGVTRADVGDGGDRVVGARHRRAARRVDEHRSDALQATHRRVSTGEDG